MGEVAPLFGFSLELRLGFPHTPNVGGFAAHVALETVSWLQHLLGRFLIVAVSAGFDRTVRATKTVRQNYRSNR